MEMMRREGGFMADSAWRSQCSSGCQSGWTLYLEHSDTGHHQQCCCSGGPPPCSWLVHVGREALLRAGEGSDEEDSMVSDASSGPPPHQREEEDREAASRQGERLGFGYSSYSGSGRRSEGSSSSGCLGSARSPSLGAAAKISKKHRPVDGQISGEDSYIDDLDDTASSPAVFSCPMTNEFVPIVDVGAYPMQ